MISNQNYYDHIIDLSCFESRSYIIFDIILYLMREKRDISLDELIIYMSYLNDPNIIDITPEVYKTMKKKGKHAKFLQERKKEMIILQFISLIALKNNLLI